MGRKEDESELPWTEEQWDQFMRKADLRSARYTELLETLIDEPDRDEIIDHEMGWDRKRDNVDTEWIEALEEAAAEAVEGGEELTDADARKHDPGELLPESALGSHKDGDYFDESDGQLHRIPAYHLAMALSKRIDAALKPMMSGSSDEPHEEVSQAFIQIKIAAAKIAGGHGMGYHEDVLGGNVVNCKRALDAAGECATALKALIKLELLPEDAAATLLAELAAVQQAIESRIAELRSRMWWQKK